MYDVSFAKLSERFFKTTSWPPVHMIADLVDGDHVFCLLYKVCAGSWLHWSSAHLIAGFKRLANSSATASGSIASAT